jgi:hypothetical protein
MKGAKNLKDGVKIGAECMKLKGKVRGLAGGLKDAEGYLGEMQDIMTGGGLDCDDSTVIQKLKALDVPTILSEGKEVAGMIDDIHSFVSNVAAAVA